MLVSLLDEGTVDDKQSTPDANPTIKIKDIRHYDKSTRLVAERGGTEDRHWVDDLFGDATSAVAQVTEIVHIEHTGERLRLNLQAFIREGNIGNNRCRCFFAGRA